MELIEVGMTSRRRTSIFPNHSHFANPQLQFIRRYACRIIQEELMLSALPSALTRAGTGSEFTLRESFIERS